MCLQVFLGSSVECQEIPYVEGSEKLFVLKFPDVHVSTSVKVKVVCSYGSGKLSALKLSYPRWARQFTVPGLTAPYQYRLGILYCGCGFDYNLTPSAFTPSGWRHDNHRQLGNYLAGCLQHSEPIQLVSYWAGEEDNPINEHRQIVLDEMFSPLFHFGLGQLTVIYKDEVG
jgi:hypothetical protein